MRERGEQIPLVISEVPPSAGSLPCPSYQPCREEKLRMGPPRLVLDTRQTSWSLLGISQSLPLSEDEESRRQEVK